MNEVNLLQDRNVATICRSINDYCLRYIIQPTSSQLYFISSFCSFLPTLLVYIFGSPTTRGWLQTELSPAEESNLKDLLAVDRPFFNSLILISQNSDYVYDITSDSLPSDIRRILATGATHLLPRVYRDLTYREDKLDDTIVDIRTAATRQSTLLANTTGAGRKIRFNCIQFYLYYIVSVSTWPALTPPTPTTMYNAAQKLPGIAYRPVSTPPTDPTYKTLKYQIPGALRSISKSVYSDVMMDYMRRMIPISHKRYPQFIGTFFLDCLIELWIRTQWISPNQKLTAENIHHITLFIKYIVGHDLRLKDNAVLNELYESVRDELCFLVSRLCINWPKNDNFIQVIDLWSVWVAPWRMGSHPKTVEAASEDPIKDGWALFILDNVPFYFHIVELILQRTATFQYKDNIATPSMSRMLPGVPAVPGVPGGTPAVANPSTFNGELRILYRLMNVLTPGMFDFLCLVEEALDFMQLGIMNSRDPLKELSLICYKTAGHEKKIKERLDKLSRMMVLLDGGIWKSKRLYVLNVSIDRPHNKDLIRTLESILNASSMYSTQKNDKSRRQDYATQLMTAHRLLSQAFKIHSMSHQSNMMSSISNNANKAMSYVNNLRINWANSPSLSVSEDGHISKKEINKIKKGKVIYPTGSVSVVGQENKEKPRSYECHQVLKWVLHVDRRLNQCVSAWIF
ncbi:hypothetical protein BDB01DRAFT_795942 [Pilobolus umbonatus]|nr:hypothetical protein BDB01DRAFT_795942 [Pilobolus umbonatus]